VTEADYGAARMTRPARLLVLVSGGGTNLQALIDAERAGALGGTEPAAPDGSPAASRAGIVAVVSDRPGVYALERARAAGIPAFVERPDRAVPRGTERRKEHSGRLLARAREAEADFIVLAGFLSILAGEIIDEFSGRIVNLHPALLPKYGGEGMWGHHVHEAVLAAGEDESGCTVHLVDAGTDTGEILLQKKVPVLKGDTPDTLAERIHAEEHKAIVEALQILIDNSFGEVAITSPDTEGRIGDYDNLMMNLRSRESGAPESRDEMNTR